jgi:hypothetical protein
MPHILNNTDVEDIFTCSFDFITHRPSPVPHRLAQQKGK